MIQAAALMLDVQFGQASDFGKVRTNNEDAIGSFIPASRRQARSHGFLFAVADGVGGMDLGEVASATAVKVLAEEFRQGPARHYAHQPAAAAHSAGQLRGPRLHARAEYRGKKMATTIVACALRHDQAVVCHVGDSRCYLVRNGVARQITQDHTWVNEQRKMGLISAQRDCRVRIPPRSDSFPGAGDVCLPRHQCAHTLAGDMLVLCTDGLHDEMSEEEDRRNRLAEKRDAADCQRTGGARRRD